MSHSKVPSLDCTRCTHRDCYTAGKDCSGLKEKAVELLRQPDNEPWMKTAAFIEGSGYKSWTRLEEIVRLIQTMKLERVGVAFCIGLTDEASRFVTVLKTTGVKVTAVCCKVCGVSKDEMGVTRLHKERAFEASCNPIAQALVLNENNTELNFTVGLCLGHDILFNKHSNAPVSAFIVKDRVLAHNPAAALYSSYHRPSSGRDSK